VFGLEWVLAVELACSVKSVVGLNFRFAVKTDEICFVWCRVPSTKKSHPTATCRSETKYIKSKFVLNRQHVIAV